MTTTDNPLSYDPTYEDTDQRIGGPDQNYDEPVPLEQLHAEAEKVKTTRTPYEVSFSEYDAPEGGRQTWVPLGKFAATTARDAIRQAFAASDSLVEGMVLRAIPVRNITTLTLGIETTTRLRLS